MSYLRSYTDGEYEITQYSSGGSVRELLTRKIVAEYTNYWTKDGTIHPETKKQFDLIKEKLGINLKEN